MRGFSADLRAAAAEIWEAQHRHPFVRGIGDGTLDPDRFRFWIRQDYLLLIEYSRLLALATARAPDLDTMTRFADLGHETLHEEMDLHRSYCADLGIPAADLEREQMAPTTRGYADFLLRTATVSDFADLVGALLPCMWGFNEIGCRLAEHGPAGDEHYARWIEMYSLGRVHGAGQLAARADGPDRYGPVRRAARQDAGDFPHQQQLRARLLGDGVDAADLATAQPDE